jgi:hypothetical protein
VRRYQPGPGERIGVLRVPNSRNAPTIAAALSKTMPTLPAGGQRPMMREHTPPGVFGDKVVVRTNDDEVDAENRVLSYAWA